jgi:aminoglycoside 2'-N-acetyltransferase I
MSAPQVETIETPELSKADLAVLRRLMDVAFGPRFTENDWNHTVGGTHFLVRGHDGTIVSHASVVDRRLEVAGEGVHTGYVEGVATHPGHQRRGLAAAVMTAVGAFITHGYAIGALSTNLTYYRRFGWVPWLGSTWCRGREGLLRTPEDDGGVWVLPTPGGPDLDPEGDIVADWRAGDVW